SPTEASNQGSEYCGQVARRAPARGRYCFHSCSVRLRPASAQAAVRRVGRETSQTCESWFGGCGKTEVPAGLMVAAVGKGPSTTGRMGRCATRSTSRQPLLLFTTAARPSADAAAL